MLYYLKDVSTKEVIVALPSKKDIEFLASVYNDRGRKVYIAHLALVLVA